MDNFIENARYRCFQILFYMTQQAKKGEQNEKGIAREKNGNKCKRNLFKVV